MSSIVRSSGAGGANAGYSTVQDEGSALTARTKLNFVGAGVTVTDDPTNTRTLVTIPGGGGTSVKDYGAVGNGTTDDTTAVQNAMTAARTAKKPLIFPDGGVYKMLGGITWDANVHSVYGYGATLDFSGMTGTGYAITVIGMDTKPSAQGFQQTINEFAGLRIIGPDSDATTIDCFKVSDIANASMVNFARLWVFGFRDQWFIGDNTWCLHWNNSTFGHAHRYCFNVEGNTNAGENYSWYGCTFHDADRADATGVAIYNQKIGASDLHFFGCSFDYSDIGIVHESGHISLTGCHFEDNSANPMIKLSYTGGFEYTSLSMQGCEVSPTEASTGRSHLIESTDGDNVLISLTGNKFLTYGRTTDIVKVLGGFPAMKWLSGMVAVASAPNIPRVGALVTPLVNSGFELGNTNGWTTTALSGVTYTAQTATKSVGTNALRIVGTGAAGSASIYQTIPCPPNANVLLTCDMSSSTFTAGEVIPKILWFGPDGTFQIGSHDFGGITSASQPFARKGALVTSPAGTAFARVGFTTTNLNGTVFVDDVQLAIL